MDEGILSLKWNNHTSTFIHTLSRLNKAELYSDLTLACDGKYFPVHKLVLSVCSDYFEEILAKTKCQHPIIVLKDIRHSDLEALLTYMYAGEANVAQSELANLIKAAECLRIKGLAVPDEAPNAREKKRQLNSNRDDSTQNSSKRRRNNSNSENSKTDNDSPCQDRLQDRSSRNRNRSSNSVESSSGLRSHIQSSHEEESLQKGSEEVVIDLDPVELDVKQEMVMEPKLEPCDFNTNSSHELSYPSHPHDLGDDGDPMNEYEGESSQHDLDFSNDVEGTSGMQDEQLGSWDSNSAGIPGYSLENYPSDDGSQMGMEASYRILRASIGANPGFAHCKKCPCCPYITENESDIKKHMRKHTGERPYECPHCSQSFTQSSSRNLHVRRLHPQFAPAPV